MPNPINGWPTHDRVGPFRSDTDKRCLTDIWLALYAQHVDIDIDPNVDLCDMARSIYNNLSGQYVATNRVPPPPPTGPKPRIIIEDRHYE